MPFLPLLVDEVSVGVHRRGVARGCLTAVAICLLTRVLVWTATYAGQMVTLRIQHGFDPPVEQRLLEHRDELADPDSPLRRSLDSQLHAFAPLLHWDAGHYRGIIEQGYYYAPPAASQPRADAQYNIAFFPLYPLACRLFAPLVGVPAAMILVSNGSTLLAAVLLYLLARRRVGHGGAIAAVTFTCAWPSACFLSYGYTEGLALLLVTLTIGLIDLGWLLPAALACAAATAARPTLLSLALVLAAATAQRGARVSGDVAAGFGGSGDRNAGFRGAGDRAAGFRSSGDRRAGSRAARGAFWGLLGCAGIIAYAICLTVWFGSPLVYFDNFAAGWIGPRDRAPWLQFVLLAPVWRGFEGIFKALANAPIGLVRLTSPMTWNMPVALALVAISLAGLPRAPRRFRPYLFLAPLIFAHTYLATGGSDFGMSNAARYTAVAAPAFIVLGAWSVREWSANLRTAVVCLLLLLQSAWAFHFGMHEWAG